MVAAVVFDHVHFTIPQELTEESRVRRATFRRALISRWGLKIVRDQQFHCSSGSMRPGDPGWLQESRFNKMTCTSWSWTHPALPDVHRASTTAFLDCRSRTGPTRS